MNRTTSAPRRTRRIALLSGAAFALAVAGGGVAAAGDAGTSGTQTKPAPPAAGTTQFLGSYSRVVGPTVTLPAGGFSSSSVTCPAGQRAFGGGESNSAFGTMVLTDSWPISTTSWLVWVKNNGGASGTYHAYVICGS